tara:strand:+ start:1487 stop:1999 length:513 start_codon:yes stop_codon:yes gene_type:complete
MNKFLTNLFSKGPNNTISLPDRSSFSYKGSWIGVHYNTVIDSFHLGEFSSAVYQITVEYDSNEKEIMQLSVVARPDRAVANIFGRSSINQELVNLSVTVDQSQVKINASPTSNTYAGAKLIFHATYAKTIHQLTPPAIVAETSSVESDGINTFDATTTYFDNTNITFDKV